MDTIKTGENYKFLYKNPLKGKICRWDGISDHLIFLYLKLFQELPGLPQQSLEDVIKQASSLNVSRQLKTYEVHTNHSTYTPSRPGVDQVLG